MDNSGDDLFTQFLQLLRGAIQVRLQALERTIHDALLDGTDPDAARAERRSLQALPATIAPAPRDELVAQWPATLPPLPAWFVDPEAAAAADPPGAPCVVDLTPVAPEPPEMLAPETEAAILDKRAERSPDDDAARVDAMERATEARAVIARKLKAEQAKKAGA